MRELNNLHSWQQELLHSCIYDANFERWWLEISIIFITCVRNISVVLQKLWHDFPFKCPWKASDSSDCAIVIVWFAVCSCLNKCNALRNDKWLLSQHAYSCVAMMPYCVNMTGEFLPLWSCDALLHKYDTARKSALCENTTTTTKWYTYGYQKYKQFLRNKEFEAGETSGQLSKSRRCIRTLPRNCLPYMDHTSWSFTIHSCVSFFSLNSLLLKCSHSCTIGPTFKYSYFPSLVIEI